MNCGAVPLLRATAGLAAAGPRPSFRRPKPETSTLEKVATKAFCPLRSLRLCVFAFKCLLVVVLPRWGLCVLNSFGCGLAALGRKRLDLAPMRLRLPLMIPMIPILLISLTLPAPREHAHAEDRGSSANLEAAWANLDSPKPAARDAARKEIEAQPLSTWKSRALGETRPWASIEALLALCHACPMSEGAALRPHLCEGITTLRIEQMTAGQTLAAIRLTRLVCTRFGEPTEDERQQMLDLWPRFLPSPPENKQTPDQRQITRELRELLSLLRGVD